MNVLKSIGVLIVMLALAACTNMQESKEETQETQVKEEIQETQETKETQETEHNQDSLKGMFTVTAVSGEDNWIELSNGEKIEGISETYIPVFVNGSLSPCVTALSKDRVVYVPKAFVENEMHLSVDGSGEKVDSIVQEDETYYNLNDSLVNTDWKVSYVDKNDEDMKGKALVMTHSSVYLYNTKNIEEEGISSEEGLEQAKVALNEGLDAFSISLKENLESSGEDTSRFDEELERIQQDIDTLASIGETLGYYIYDMHVYRVMVDKYTGQVYVNYETGLTTYSLPVGSDGSDNSNLFMPLYIVG